MSDHLRKNPFFILGIDPSATRIEVERKGQMLLGMIELGLEGSSTYTCPLGECTRTADDVRVAMAELRDPNRRAAWEIWARAKTAPRTVEKRVTLEGVLEMFGFPR